MAANEEFINAHSFTTLYGVANSLQNGVPRDVVGIPEGVTLTAEEIVAAAKQKYDEHYADLKAMTVPQLVDMVRDTARDEGYNEAADFGPCFPKYDSYDYAEELKTRFEALSD